MNKVECPSEPQSIGLDRTTEAVCKMQRNIKTKGTSKPKGFKAQIK